MYRGRYGTAKYRNIRSFLDDNLQMLEDAQPGRLMSCFALGCERCAVLLGVGLHAGKFELEIFGSYETSFLENDTNPNPWPIPNVIGVRPRTAKAK
jgi:hypothetical protein